MRLLPERIMTIGYGTFECLGSYCGRLNIAARLDTAMGSSSTYKTCLPSIEDSESNLARTILSTISKAKPKHCCPTCNIKPWVFAKLEGIRRVKQLPMPS